MENLTNKVCLENRGGRAVSIEVFSQQVSSMHSRLSNLFKQADQSSYQPSTLVPAFVKELGIVMEELQVAMEELQHQNQSLSEAIEMVARERKRYQDLFQSASEAYLVTTLEGKIQEANRRAAEMLGISVEFLIGKPLPLYVSEEQRAAFRMELLQRSQRDCFKEWELCLQSRQGRQIRVACLVLAIRDQTDQPTGFRWAIRDISERKQIESFESNGNGHRSDIAAILQDLPQQEFCQGDLIPLNTQTLWYINRGLVKLTTLTEQSQEVLIGILGPGMPFGAYLTSLQLYEATALTDVQVTSVSVNAIAHSCPLAQYMFLKTRQRLQQTETWLAISGERQIEDRLCRLLKLLQDQAGEPTPQGTRLSIRLTQEDLANACCTTRVTISRVLSQLQQSGKIALDVKKYIIILKDLSC
jgi:PAS domain S-box-containing protein